MVSTSRNSWDDTDHEGISRRDQMSIRIRLILNRVVYTYVATQSSMTRPLDEQHSVPRDCLSYDVFVVVF